MTARPPSAPPPVTRLLALVLTLLPAVAAGQPAPPVAPARAPAAASAAATTEPFVVPRLTGAVRLDGVVDEAAWEAVAPLPLVTHWPAFGAAPSERTEIRLAHDDEYVYVSCRCYAPPEAVFAASFRRDLQTLGTDYLALSLDTFGDRQTGVMFQVSPTGSRTDATLSGDGAPADGSWNTFWDAEALVTPEGWFAEMRIPFSSLRFRPVDGRVTMGLSAWRYLGKKNELDIYPAIPPEWGFWSFAKASQFQPAVFEGVRAARPIYVTPYTLGGMGQAYALDADGAAYVRTDDPVTEAGADLKLGLTDDLTLDLTLNTDFAQVEADVAQVNLTRFSLFFPEQRQFFLERASLFGVGFGGDDRLFYSRRVGLTGGQPVRILGGGRLVGRAGAWDVGLINLQTAALTVGGKRLPTENVGVLRLRRPVFNARSTAGGVVTTRIGDDGTTNVALGLDGDLQIAGESFLTVALGQTFDDAVSDRTALLAQTRLRAKVERRSYTGSSYSLALDYAGREYRPDLGFQLRQNFSAVKASLAQGWRPAAGSRLARHRVTATGAAFLRNADRTVETAEGSVEWDGALASGASFTAGATLTNEDLLTGFALSDDAGVPAGAYTFASARASYDTPGGEPRSAAVSVGGGQFYDGWRATAGVSPKWVASRFLELSGRYEINRIAFPSRDEVFTAHVARIRVQAALNTRWSLSSLAQVNSAARGGVANVRLRYSPREGRDLYLVVNEGFNTDRLRLSPGLPFTSQRAVLAKYTHTFAL